MRQSQHSRVEANPMTQSASPKQPSLTGRLAAILLAIALATLAVAAQSAPPGDYALIPAASRIAAPDFLLTGIDGKKPTLSQYRGRIVLLDFWAVDCGGCKIEIPWYVDFDRSYR